MRVLYVNKQANTLTHRSTQSQSEPAAIKYNGYEVWPGNYSRSDDRIYDIHIKTCDDQTHSTQNTATFIRYDTYKHILQGKEREKNCIGHFDLSSTLQ